MHDSQSHQLVFSSVPDRNSGKQIATILVKEQLAACVNLIPEILSTYQWDNGIQHDEECLLIIKTRADVYKDLQTRLQQLHPYELPEIIALPICTGLPDYLQWINTCLDKTS
ncbi:MAG: divalent-cation tolerance protein CutA [Gammaproteobacteria bacterium]